MVYFYRILIAFYAVCGLHLSATDQLYLEPYDMQVYNTPPISFFQSIPLIEDPYKNEYYQKNNWKITPLKRTIHFKCLKPESLRGRITFSKTNDEFDMIIKSEPIVSLFSEQTEFQQLQETLYNKGLFVRKNKPDKIKDFFKFFFDRDWIPPFIFPYLVELTHTHPEKSLNDFPINIFTIKASMQHIPIDSENHIDALFKHLSCFHPNRSRQAECAANYSMHILLQERHSSQQDKSLKLFLNLMDHIVSKKIPMNNDWWCGMKAIEGEIHLRLLGKDETPQEIQDKRYQAWKCFMVSINLNKNPHARINILNWLRKTL